MKPAIVGQTDTSESATSVPDNPAEMTRLRLIFCGTPEFAVPTLEALIAARHDLALVVSQPDRPIGRKQVITAPPVKQLALAHSIPVAQPEKIKNNVEFRAQLEAIRPDAIVVVAYGRIIPRWMLDLPRLGCINLHGSLLPKYRGAAPIQWAVANGEAETGNTTMLLEEGLDTGPMLLQQPLPIAPYATAVDLFHELAHAGAPLMTQTLAGLQAGTIQPEAQQHELATLAPILTREDGHMDFLARTAQDLYNRWRGFQPWPGAFALLDGKKLIVHRMRVLEAGIETGLETRIDELAAIHNTLAPGEIIARNGRMLTACAQGTMLELLEVQPEGRTRMQVAEFLRGAQPAAGSRLI